MDGMDGMDMGGGGGHADHQPSGINSGLNHSFARDYWYLAAGVAGLLLVLRGLSIFQARTR